MKLTTILAVVFGLLALSATSASAASAVQAIRQAKISGGIVEGKTQTEWDKSTRYKGPGKLLVHNGADGKLLAEYDLPACPVFDGLSAADGKIIIPMVNGQMQCMSIDNNNQ